MTPLKNRSTAPRPMVALAALVALLTLAGCGASTSTSTQDSDTTTQTGGPATDSETSAAAGDGGSGSATGDFCLNTAEEVATAFEVDGVEATSFENPGVGSGCSYADPDGGIIFGIAMGSSDVLEASFREMAQDEGSEQLNGIGDDAFYLPVDFVEGVEAFALYFKKGNVVVNFGPSSFDMLGGDHARLRAATEELARIAAGRL